MELCTVYVEIAMHDEILSGTWRGDARSVRIRSAHYERVGVLSAKERGANVYRLFPPESVDRVRLVRRALAIGFSLVEAERIRRQRDGGSAPGPTVRALAGAVGIAP